MAESIPCDASRACHEKGSRNGCWNRTPIPYTSRLDVISREDGVIVGGLRQADLVDLSQNNNGMTFPLTVINVFSKVAWCFLMKNKSAASLVAALDSTFSRGWPKTLQTDQGLEFLNKSVQALLKKHGIHHFSTHNAETKASVVERFNRTLKTRMWRYFTKHQTWRYIDVLQDLVQSYNNTPTAVSVWLRHR